MRILRKQLSTLIGIFISSSIACSVDGHYTPVKTVTLSVSVGGSSPGVVNSNPSGVNCDAGTCSQQFTVGTPVELVATSSSGSFLGWSDACTGFGSCVVTMDTDKSVGALFGAPGQALWVQHAGGVSDDEGRAIAHDTDGNLVVTGEFRGTMQLGAFGLTSAGGRDVFVAKLASDTGNVVWAKRFGGAGEDTTRAIETDDSNNVYLVGRFEQSVDFGGGITTSTGEADGFALKLDSSGGYAWAIKLGGASFDEASSIAVRGNAVVVSGRYRGLMTVNGMTITSVGFEDMYVVALATDGAIRWLKSFGGSSTSVTGPNGVAIDGSGDVIVGGLFAPDTNLGGGVFQSKGRDDAFVAKYAGPTGAHLFSKSFGGPVFDRIHDVAADSADSIFLFGKYAQTVDFGGPAPFVAPNGGLFVLKLSVVGAYTWGNSITGAESAFFDTGAGALASVSTGEVVVTGDFFGSVSFGGEVLSPVGDADLFSARFKSSDGAHIKSMRGGGTQSDRGWGVTQLPDGRVFVVGEFGGFSEFGGTPVTTDGANDIVVFGLAP